MAQIQQTKIRTKDEKGDWQDFECPVQVFDTLEEAVEILGAEKALQLLNYSHTLNQRHLQYAQIKEGMTRKGRR